MILVIKKRARKPLAVAKAQPFIAPHGIGGLSGECVGFDVGEMHICIERNDWLSLVKNIADMWQNDVKAN